MTISITSPTSAITIAAGGVVGERYKVFAGASWAWTVVDSDRSPAAGWSLAFRFVGATNVALTTAANAANDGWTVAHAAASTASVTAGRYEWFAVASKSGTVDIIARGEVTVEANPLAATGIDSRSSARIALEAIEAMIAGRASAAQKQYEIAGRKVEFFSLEDLLKARDRLRIDVRREDACAAAAAGLPDSRRILVSFR